MEIADKALIDFLQTTDTSNISLSNYQKYLNSSAQTASRFSRVTSIAGKTLKAFAATTANAAIGIVAFMAIKKVIDLFDRWANRVEYAKEAMDSSQESYVDATEKLQDLKDELIENNEKLRELESAKGLGEIVDQSEIDKLKETNEELRQNIELEKTRLKIAASDAWNNSTDWYNTTIVPVQKTDSLYDEQVKSAKESAITGVEYYTANDGSNIENSKNNIASLIGLYEGLNEVKNENYRKIQEEQSAIKNLSEEEQRLAYDRIKGYQSANSEIDTSILKTHEYIESQKSDLNTLVKSFEQAREAGVILDSEDANMYRNALSLINELNSILGITSVSFEDTGNSADNASEKIERFKLSTATRADAIEKVNTLGEGFEKLAEVYNSIREDKQLDLSLLDEDFSNIFSGAEAYEDFIHSITDSQTDITGCQEAFDELIYSWLNAEDITSVLNDETVELIGTFLEEQGVVDATSWLMDELAARKALASAESKGLTVATADEITALMDEQFYTDEARAALARLVLQKVTCNGTVITTDGDIANLIALADQANATAEELARVKSFQKIQSGKYDPSMISPEEYAFEEAAALGAVNRTLDYRPGENKGSQANSSGNSYSPKISDKSKSSSGSGSSSDKSVQKEIDWIERKNELLQREHDIKQEIANDESVSYTERKSAIQDLINQDKERVSIAEQSASEYEKKWNEAIANLKASDISKIMHGELVIDNYDSDELEKQGIADGKIYIENLEKALELYDLKEDALQKQSDIEKESIEHQKESIRLLQDEIGYQKDLNSAMSDQVNSRIELMQARGEYVTKGSYEELIRISKQMETLHQDNIDALYEQLDLEDEGSAEYYSILASIEECEDALIQCKVEQEEWNYKIQRLPIDRIQTYINMLEDIKEDATNWGSEISVDGISLNMEQYQQLIDLNAEEIDALVKQQEKLQKLLNNYQYGSDRFNEVSDEIQSVQNQMSSLIQEQKEYNYAILQIPIDEMAEQVEELANVKTALQNSIAEDNAKGLQTTIDQYKDLHSLTLQQIQLLVKQRETLTSALDSYEEGSDKYKEVESQIDGISDSISGLVQETYKWNQEMLNIPIDRLEKLNGNLSSYSSILGDVISDYDSALDGINALIDGEIDGIQSILDGITAQNKEIQIQRNLEQSLYDLRRAEQQRTTKVIRDGVVEYDVDSDALRSAKEQYADAEFEAIQFSLEKQIEQLETIRDKWQGIVEEIEKAKSLQDAEDLFGADSKWKESILTGSDDALYEMLQTLYKSTTEQKEFVDSQIESNDRISQMMNEFVTRYQEGSITYEQALSGINDMIQSMEGGYTALENLSGMMNLDNINGLENIASSTQEQINQSADLLKQYMTIVEANKQSVEGFETNWSEVSGSIEGIIESFDNAVSSIDSYISTFEKNADAINENTKTWDEMKSSIKIQAEALKKAAEELEKLANAKKTSSSSGNRGSSSSSGSVSSGGSKIWAGGEAHSESKGSTAEIIGQYGTQEEKDRYEKYRQQQIDNNPNASNKAWKDAADKALQEELKNANVKKYHDGIKSGYVGGNTIKLSDMPDDKLWNYAYKIALDKLRTDEVFAILKKGEGVLTPNQMQNVISNSEMVGRAGASVISEVPVHKNLQNSYDCSIGELHLHEVQNPDGLAKALDQHFASTMKQQMSKYKLYF